MVTNTPDRAATIELDAARGTPLLRAGGAWTLRHYHELTTKVDALRTQVGDEATLDLSALTALDTAGAQLLGALAGPRRLQAALADMELAPGRRELLAAVADAMTAPPPPRAKKPRYLADVLEHIGEATATFWRHIADLLVFVGAVLDGIARTVPHPRRWRIDATVAMLEQTGFNAVPIVALLTFLVGAVVAFLGATVLAYFGATIYTVSLVTYAFLREFGVLLAAILMAGRTASSFAAQIGSMRVNEEIDALSVLGLDPLEMLVLPRVLAMMLALPILTFIAMVCGIAGGMTVCAVSLNISPGMFLATIQNEIDPLHFYIGLGKAPIFAFLIAAIGCLEGFRVGGSAQSVGEHTTSAVVQSIFTVIVVDAIAAIFCMEMNW
ncbi:MAG: ABC transporter permease [Azoarcus sp.]|jgi:phospholipid/cholesterol/gamma-HCH transport system permease protein|nr:ABC transporter permease [Azoarcus sp.]